jgi:hypothetical protein
MGNSVMGSSMPGISTSGSSMMGRKLDLLPIWWRSGLKI